MALFPCAQGRHRYPGQQRSVYASVLGGEIGSRAKLRLCGPHFFNYLANVRELMSRVEEDTDSTSNPIGRCFVCGIALEQQTHPIAVVTAYDRASDPEQYMAPVCEDHIDEAEQNLALEPQEGQEGTLATRQAPSVQTKKK